MKRNIHFLIALLALALCLFLWLHRQPPRSRVGQQESIQSGTPPPAQQGRGDSRLTAAATQLNTEPPRAARTASPTPVEPLDPASAHQRLLTEWQAPIDFYGKVVDESSNAVSGASVQFNWTETPVEVLEEGGGKKATRLSDTNGLFELHGARGPSLAVSVSKQGYYTSKQDPWSFKYAISGHFSPDPTSPIIFHVRRKSQGANLIRVKRNYSVPRDGTPLAINLDSGSVTLPENASLVVRCWTQDEGKRNGQHYDWRCVLSIPGGGLAPTKEEFAVLAPENDYLPATEIVMLADRADWTDDVDLKSFYRLPDGRYGVIMFSMIAGGQHFCMIDSLLNPSGSRNLEPAN